MTKLAEIKAALEAATPGPWITAADPSHYDSQSEIYRVEDGEFVASTGGKWDTLEANARLIVEAVNNLPKLLKVAEAAEEAVIAEDAGFEAVNNGGDLTLAAERMSDAVEALRKALEELNDE